ncbi:hypothetical protein GCM10017667_18620 [Streptomyces filamentosus]|uniref:Uncharacterized protein n=1 Tax=Streptomyces filamentosus TaxID=67294 RepID=A0A919BGQ3_STRFL|nr:hypothetical protein GCM10017667_18620 [Streptomyces filamentosus]
MSGTATAPEGAALAGAAPASAPRTRAEDPARAESLAESFMWGLRIPNGDGDGTCETPRAVGGARRGELCECVLNGG